MTTDQIIDGLPHYVGNITSIPSRIEDKTITLMTFATKNSLGHASQYRRHFIGRMDTNEEIKAFADTQFSNFVTEVVLLTIQFYSLESTNIANIKLR